MYKELIKEIENWIKDYIASVHAKGVVLGMSGGKDSLVVAKLCADAIGKENVLGIIMPNGAMRDSSVAVETCQLLGIRYYSADIRRTYDSVIENVENIIRSENANLSTVTTFNVPPRIRMTTLYAIAGSLGYLVANTSNLSEGMVGYTTKWGDNVGDFSPIANFTKTEVCEIGLALGLPKHLVLKVPDDGLSGLTDEDNLGVTYADIDSYIRTGDADNKDRINSLYRSSEHKRVGVAKFDPEMPNYLKENHNELIKGR